MLFAALLTPDGVLLLDNIDGTLKSATLAAIFTKPTYTDRVLGESRRVTVPTNVLFLATGNGVTVLGDLNRRFLRCTIDPRMERPDTRRFDFNPLDYVKQHRIGMVRAALLLMRAYQASGTQPAAGAMASFETWDRLVRQTVCWLAGEFPDFRLADPLEATTAAYDVDPEKLRLSAVLQAWRGAFGDEWKTLAEVRKASHRLENAELLEALVDVAGERDGLNSRRLGWYCRRFKGRIVGKLMFEQNTEWRYARYRVGIAGGNEKEGITGTTGITDDPYAESVSDNIEIGAGDNDGNAGNTSAGEMEPEEGTL